MSELEVEVLDLIYEGQGPTLSVRTDRFPPRIACTDRYLTHCSPRWLHPLPTGIKFTLDNGWAEYEFVRSEYGGSCRILDLVDSHLEVPSE